MNYGTNEIPKNGYCLKNKFFAYFGMGHPVVVEIWAGRERFAANRTRVRSFSAVDTLVRVQRAGRGERFVALRAGVGTFSCRQLTKPGKVSRWKFVYD